MTTAATETGAPDASSDTVGNTGTESRFAAGAELIRGLVSRQRMNFFVAVGGAAVFATFTAGSSLGIRWMIDHVIVPRFEEGSVAWSTVLAGCLLLVMISLVRAGAVVVRRTFATRAQWRVAESLTMEVLGRYGAQPIQWHGVHGTGNLVARAAVDTETSVHVLGPLPYGSSTVLLLVISVVGLLVTDVAIGVVALVVLPLLLAANVGYQRRVDRHFDSAQEKMGELSRSVLESFEAVAVVKAYGAEERETARLSSIAAGLRDARVRAVRARATFELILDTVPALANLSILLVGSYRVRSGDLSVGELVSAIYLFTLLVVPLRLIGYVFSELPYSLAGWRRVRAVVDEPLVPDPRDSLRKADEDDALRLDDVSLAHGENVVLSGASCVVAPGHHTAIVGPTGSGKTSLLRAIAGLMPVAEGTISIAPHGVGYVQQEPFIFSESVEFNLCLGRSVDPAIVDEALRIADARFLLELGDGLATTLGERGTSLSGGQRQRLALARELVARPGLLLLDDTTSALDPQTELRVMESLQSTSLVGTIVMVASRPSTIMAASAVIFLDGARGLHASTHLELMETQPAYRRLIEAFDDDRRISRVE